MPASLRNNKRAKVQRLVIAQPFSPLSEHRHLSALSTSLQSVFFSTVILTGGKKPICRLSSSVPSSFLFHLVFFFRNRFDLQRKYISDENPSPLKRTGRIEKSLYSYLIFFFYFSFSNRFLRWMFRDFCFWIVYEWGFKFLKMVKGFFYDERFLEGVKVR